MQDPEELALVVKALTDGLGGCHRWDEKAARRLLETYGIRASALTREVYEYVKRRGSSGVTQIIENREEYRLVYSYYYKVILPHEQFVEGFFVEIRLVEANPEFPRLLFVSAHPQGR